MLTFEKRFQLWQDADQQGTFTPYEHDTLQDALVADRYPDGNWYVTERLTKEQIQEILDKELEGHPSVRRDPLALLQQTYQLWSGNMGGAYALTGHAQLIEALKAPRSADDWCVTQVIDPAND